MNHPLTISACACACAFLVATTSSRAAAINFDTTGDLANNFNVAVAQGTGSTSGFSETTTGGILSSPGSLLYTPGTFVDSTALYKLLGFSFTADGATLSESVMFHTGAGTTTPNSRTIQLGFSTNLNGGFNGSPNQITLAAFTSVRLSTTSTANSYNIEGQEKAIGTSSTTPTNFGTTSIPLLANNWYRFTITLTNLTGAGTYSIGAIVEDFGSDGVTGGSTVASFPTTNRTIADLDTTLFGGFRAAGATTNTTNYDTYSVVPEPASFGVLAGGIGLLCLVRRRSALIS